LAHFVRFSVSNLAGRHLTHNVELNRDVNIFFAQNGGGKTSLLRILYSAAQNDPVSLINVPFDHAEVVIYSSAFNKEFTGTIDKSDLVRKLSLIGTGSDISKPAAQRQLSNRAFRARAGLTWNQSQPMPSEISAWQCAFLPTTRLLPAADSDEEFIRHEQTAASAEKSLAAFWQRYNARLQNTVRTIHQKGLALILHAVLTWTDTVGPASILEPRLAYIMTNAFLHNQQPPIPMPMSEEQFIAQYTNSAILQNIVSFIDAIQKEIELALAPRSQLQSLITRLFSDNKIVSIDEARIQVHTPEGEAIRIGALSSGEQQLLRIFIELVNAGESSLLIDEPELSMHIDWQQELIADMMQLNPKSQLILATHSPEIMADVSDEHIFRL